MIKTLLAAVVAGAFLLAVPLAHADDKPAAGEKAEKSEKKVKTEKKETKDTKKDEKAGAW